jgi:hypothetical protein
LEHQPRQQKKDTPQKGTPVPNTPETPVNDDLILQLQRQYGNRAVIQMMREGRLGAGAVQSLQGVAGNKAVIQMARDGVIQRAELENPEIDMTAAQGSSTMISGTLTSPLMTMGPGGPGQVLPGPVEIISPQFPALDIRTLPGLARIRYADGGPGAPAEQAEQAEQAE